MAAKKRSFGTSEEATTFFTEVLHSRGLDALLELLNARVKHRYTAVYRRRDQLMNSLALCDADSPLPSLRLMSVERGHSFCQYVMRDGHFTTEDSASDRRLDGHIAQGKMATYHGVALTDLEGNAVGSLCHFDPKIRFLEANEFSVLQWAGHSISTFLAVSAEASP